MIWISIGVVIVAALVVGVSFVFIVLPPDDVARERLTRLWQDARLAVPKVSFRQVQKERATRVLEEAGKMMPTSRKETSRTSFLMIRAGYRRPESIVALQGAKIVLPVVLLALVYLTGFYRLSPILILAGAGIGGFLAPDFWLTSRIRHRQHKITKGFPDALDLLTVCVEAGLGLDQGLYRVGQDIFITCPELSDEMKLMNMESRLGKSRADAMRDMGTRTGVEDIQTAVAMLIQTDRFGTDLAKALRVHSDTMRLKRRQRAEEMAAKASVKMVPALVFFIFPAMFVVILGPAIIALMQILVPNMK
jgi:tight adherence protein C